MAELTGLARSTFLSLFLPAYNGTHGTVYAGEPKETEHQEWDYYWEGSGRHTPPLMVQLTRAASDEVEERAKRTLAGQWTYREIHAPLLASDMKGFKLTLALHSLPKDKRGRAAMGEVLRQRVLGGRSVPLALGERRLLPPYSLDDGLAELELEGVESERSEISVTGPPFQYAENLTAPRALLALRKKQARLGTTRTAVALAIFFDLTSYEDADVAEMSAAATQEGILFREVWVVSPWQPGARADRVWPALPS